MASPGNWNYGSEANMAYLPQSDAELADDGIPELLFW